MTPTLHTCEHCTVTIKRLPEHGAHEIIHAPDCVTHVEFELMPAAEASEEDIRKLVERNLK